MQWIMPFGDQIINLLLTCLKMFEEYINVKIVQSQKKISQIQNEINSKKASIMGFTINNDDDKEGEQHEEIL